MAQLNTVHIKIYTGFLFGGGGPQFSHLVLKYCG